MQISHASYRSPIRPADSSICRFWLKCPQNRNWNGRTRVRGLVAPTQTVNATLQTNYCYPLVHLWECGGVLGTLKTENMASLNAWLVFIEPTILWWAGPRLLQSSSSPKMYGFLIKNYKSKLAWWLGSPDLTPVEYLRGYLVIRVRRIDRRLPSMH